MNKIQTAVTAMVAGVTLAAASAVLADAGHHMGRGMGMGHDHGNMDHVDRSARVETHLNDMKTQLKITAAQEPAWQAFTAAAKQRAADMQAMHASMQQDSGNAAERMAQHSAAMQQRGAAMAAMSDAFNTLYAALTPEQKAIADQNFGKMGHRGKKGPGHRHG